MAIPDASRVGSPVSSINVTPMIDVMLVLLIIFMVITPGLVGARLPEARQSAPEREDRVTLGIDARGGFSVDERPVADARLESALRAQYARRPDDHVLYLKADRDVRYSRVLTAMEAARSAGVRRIGAITELPDRQRRD